MKTISLATRLTALTVLMVVMPTYGAPITIDFESDTVGSAPAGWQFDGDSSAVQVATTANSGSYVGGKAINTDDGGASFAGYAATVGGIPTGIQADMLWDYRGKPATGFGDPTLQVNAWVDAGDDGIFSSGERTVGFNMDNDGDFEFLSGGGELDGATSTGFSVDTWYRLTLTWSDPDGAGDRDLTLSAVDLTNNNNLGVINTITMSAGDFGADPADWDGVAFRMTRGTIDNIVLIPEPSTMVLTLGGLVGLCLARRRSKSDAG